MDGIVPGLNNDFITMANSEGSKELRVPDLSERIYIIFEEVSK